MGLFNSMANYAHKSELRESKDEIVCGEIIRGLSHRAGAATASSPTPTASRWASSCPATRCCPRSTSLVDRRSGSGALTQTMGSKTVIGFTAEMRNKVSDPDDLATMWRTDLANLFKMPVAGEVRINHQLNTVNARTYHLVDLDQYVQGHAVQAGPLVDWIVAQVDALREQLRPLKK